ncbi:DUF1653 domain-containing protein [Streptomyces fumanus]|uniref:DUF1653 domain-containing protein n=1 Tax=Streptomyces fumanus TaxID=67302 RepID=A0A919AFS8_9ACTN|nr:DUF1653 domain-containing protein [Streptomyces fumanus]GHF03088.1 hypothetical protein GCM10018772_29900 [Streptomyces fumanus]
MTYSGAALYGNGCKIRPGIYRHYKGELYRVLHVAQHSETSEQLVVYQGLYGKHDIWARPLSMFQEAVETQSGPKQRFSFVRDE